MRLFLLAIIFLLVSADRSQAQFEFWEKLEKVRFVSKENPDDGYHYYYPVFEGWLKDMEGTIVEVEGYYLPYDVGRKSVILSKLPLAACFFCGGAGPESVMQINFEEKHTFETDEIIQVSGILRLNPDDETQLNFILDKAKLIPKYEF